MPLAVSNFVGIVWQGGRLPHLWTILRRLTKSWVRSGWKGEICELLSCRQAGKTREVQPGKNRPRRTRDSLWRNVGWTHRSKMQQQRPRWQPAEQRPGHTPEIILIWIHSLNGGKSLLINVVGGNDNEILNQILTFLVNDILMLASLNLQIGLSTSPSSMDRVFFMTFHFRLFRLDHLRFLLRVLLKKNWNSWITAKSESHV